MRKNGFVVMGHLLKLVTPLAHIMAFTITMGTLGFLAAIFIMVLGAMGLVNLLNFVNGFVVNLLNIFCHALERLMYQCFSHLKK